MVILHDVCRIILPEVLPTEWKPLTPRRILPKTMACPTSLQVLTRCKYYLTSHHLLLLLLVVVIIRIKVTVCVVPVTSVCLFLVGCVLRRALSMMATQIDAEPLWRVM